MNKQITYKWSTSVENNSLRRKAMSYITDNYIKELIEYMGDAYWVHSSELPDEWYPIYVFR